MYVYELSGCGFNSGCCHLNLRHGACFMQGFPWHSGKYRLIDYVWWMAWLHIYVSVLVAWFVLWLVSSIVEVEKWRQYNLLLYCHCLLSFLARRFLMIESSSLMPSDSGPRIWIQPDARLYKPTSFLLCFSLILFNTKMLINSQTSAPSYLRSHGDVKKFSLSFHPRFFITKQKWFSGVVRNLHVVSTDISYFFTKFEYFG